jgi:hypothetical protein
LVLFAKLRVCIDQRRALSGSSDECRGTSLQGFGFKVIEKFACETDRSAPYRRGEEISAPLIAVTRRYARCHGHIAARLRRCALVAETEVTSYVDHNLLQVDNLNAEDHLFLESAADDLGFGIRGPTAHQPRRAYGPSVSQEILLGSDSHTPAAGSLACWRLALAASM